MTEIVESDQWTFIGAVADEELERACVLEPHLEAANDRPSVCNPLHDVALRGHDIGEMQGAVAERGLSSLVRAEPRDDIPGCRSCPGSVDLLDPVIAADGETSTRGSSPTRRRTLRLAEYFAHARVEVAGEFTAWVPIEMPLGADRCFSLVVEMPRGARWRYQFLVDNDSWINDPDADDYEDTPSGSATSLLCT